MVLKRKFYCIIFARFVCLVIIKTTREHNYNVQSYVYCDTMKITETFSSSVINSFRRPLRWSIFKNAVVTFSPERPPYNFSLRAVPFRLSSSILKVKVQLLSQGCPLYDILFSRSRSKYNFFLRNVPFRLSSSPPQGQSTTSLSGQSPSSCPLLPLKVKVQLSQGCPLQAVLPFKVKVQLLSQGCPFRLSSSPPQSQSTTSLSGLSL